MRNRLIQALKAISQHLSENGLAGIPDSVLALAGRIAPEDFRMMYVLLMKYPNISAEWVIRGKGEMLINQDPHTNNISLVSSKQSSSIVGRLRGGRLI